MALPQLNASPKYEMKVPSTGTTVKYRPFLVKEEKVLLLAMESQDPSQIFGAIKDTIKACIDGEFNVKVLTSFDVEYMFIKLRGKSVGETSNVIVKCQAEGCGEGNDVAINLGDIEVDMSGVAKKLIKLDDKISVEMRFPTFDEIFADPDIANATGSAQLFAVLRKCVSAILTDDERIDLKDHSNADIDGFIESTNQDQFKMLTDFVESMPKLSHDISFTCSTCQHENKITLEGMQDFF